MIKRWRYVWVWARERKKSWGKCRKINGILMDNKMVLTSWREEKIVKNLIMLEIAYRKSLKVGDYLSKFLDNVALNASIWKYYFREIIVVTISIKFHMLMHAREERKLNKKDRPLFNVIIIIGKNTILYYYHGCCVNEWERKSIIKWEFKRWYRCEKLKWLHKKLCQVMSSL